MAEGGSMAKEKGDLMADKGPEKGGSIASGAALVGLFRPLPSEARDRGANSLFNCRDVYHKPPQPGQR
jgi:hypothetical protein